MKPPLAWLKRVHTGERERRQWVAGNDAEEAREMAADLRERVLTFKDDARKQGVAFATDRDAWDAFRQLYPLAPMEFTGGEDRVGPVIREYAFEKFKRIWGSERKPRRVHFQGDGTVDRAPTLFTVGHDDMLARTDILEALKLRDPEERALALAEIEHARARYQKQRDGLDLRLQYIDKVENALKGGLVAIENTVTGEIIVQALLPGADTEEDGDGAE